MTKTLTPEQIAAFRDNGHLHPFDGICRDEAKALCDDLAPFEHNRDMAASAIITKSHLGESPVHHETPDKKNLLARSQSIKGIDATGAVDLVLKAGHPCAITNASSSARHQTMATRRGSVG